jgi:hypothetical protein
MTGHDNSVLYSEHAYMSYRDKYRLDLSGRDRPPTKSEWVATGFLVLMAALMMARAVMGESGPAWLKLVEMWPIAVSELVLAWLFLQRARRNGADERFTPRALRLAALLFAFLAVATIVVSALNSQGAN